jgi:hypothetical protein
LYIKGKMQDLPAAGPEEATHEEVEGPGEAPKKGVHITKNNNNITNLVDPEPVLNNCHNSFHTQEMSDSCRNCRRNLWNTSDS